ncbi:MAG: biotin/lipoyl-containing protein [Nitrososphaerota archaeon]|nr:biotin/lipoyl-containing protein [Nitrososphaerota archaeon]
MVEVKMPRFDPLMEEGRIVEWLKSEGDHIEKDEVLVVIEGEKTTFELPSPYKGKLLKILKKKDETVKVGETIAIIEEM